MSLVACLNIFSLFNAVYLVIYQLYFLDLETVYSPQTLIFATYGTNNVDKAFFKISRFRELIIWNIKGLRHEVASKTKNQRMRGVFRFIFIFINFQVILNKVVLGNLQFYKTTVFLRLSKNWFSVWICSDSEEELLIEKCEKQKFMFYYELFSILSFVFIPLKIDFTLL